MLPLLQTCRFRFSITFPSSSSSSSAVHFVLKHGFMLWQRCLLLLSFFFISPLLQALLGMLLQSCGGAFKECSKNHFLNQCARNFVCAAAMHCTSRAALAGLSVLSLHRQCCTSGLFWKNPTNFHFQSPIRVEYPSQQRLILLCFCCGDPFFLPVSWRLITFVATLLSV